MPGPGPVGPASGEAGAAWSWNGPSIAVLGLRHGSKSCSPRNIATKHQEKCCLWIVVVIRKGSKKVDGVTCAEKGRSQARTDTVV